MYYFFSTNQTKSTFHFTHLSSSCAAADTYLLFLPYSKGASPSLTPSSLPPVSCGCVCGAYFSLRLPKMISPFCPEPLFPSFILLQTVMLCSAFRYICKIYTVHVKNGPILLNSGQNPENIF